MSVDSGCLLMYLSWTREYVRIVRSGTGYSGIGVSCGL